jgi:hypothetical protein
MEFYFIVQWKGLIKGTNKIYSIERFSDEIQQQIMEYFLLFQDCQMKYHKKLMEIFLLFAGLSNDNVGWKLGGQLTL